jgi:hypothetical protein
LAFRNASRAAVQEVERMLDRIADNPFNGWA